MHHIFQCRTSFSPHNDFPQFLLLTGRQLSYHLYTLCPEIFLVLVLWRQLAMPHSTPSLPPTSAVHLSGQSPTSSSRKQSQTQHSGVARSAIMSHRSTFHEGSQTEEHDATQHRQSAPTKSVNDHILPPPSLPRSNGFGASSHRACLSDTPVTTAPNSPKM